MTLKVLFIGRYDIALHNIRPEAEMIIGLKERGVDVEVMTAKSCEYARRMQACGIKIHDHVPERKFSATSVRYVRRVLREGNHNVIHLFNNKAIVAGVLASAGLPVKVVTYRGQTGNISRFDPVCYLTHLSPRVDAIVCVADAVRDSLRMQLANPAKAHTIYKGHDPSWYADVQPARRDELGIPDDAFALICVANNRPRKGVPVLIDAAGRVARDIPLKVLLVGAGMDSPEITERVEASGRSADFIRFSHRDDVLSLVAACDASVLPAIKREGLPKTVIESMALGITPIVTSTGGSPELVASPSCGLVVPPDDAAALASAIAELAAAPDRNRAMGKKARERIGQHFHLTTSIDEHLTLYRRLTAADPAAAHNH